MHLHRARVLAATGKVDEAIEEVTREIDAPHGGQVYARECIANAWHTLGALRYRQGNRAGATAAFERALNVVPGHLFVSAAIGRDVACPPRRQDPHSIDLVAAQAVGLA